MKQFNSFLFVFLREELYWNGRVLFVKIVSFTFYLLSISIAMSSALSIIDIKQM